MEGVVLESGRNLSQVYGQSEGNVKAASVTDYIRLLPPWRRQCFVLGRIGTYYRCPLSSLTSMFPSAPVIKELENA